MATARIFKRPKNAMQSGKYRTDAWQLEFEPSEPKRPDPLTGWAGSGDTRDQVRLFFPTLEAAVAYCEDVKDYISRDLFARILASEEEHVDTLERQFEMIERMGIHNYVQLNSLPEHDKPESGAAPDLRQG